MAGPSAAGLVGFSGAVGFVCSNRASRILGCGCNLKQLASEPVWETSENKCALCGK
jgi:hypothetical protein